MKLVGINNTDMSKDNYRPPVNKGIVEERDYIGKQAAIAFFKRRNIILHENKDIYGIDLFGNGIQVECICMFDNSWFNIQRERKMWVPYKKMVAFDTNGIKTYFTVCNRFATEIFIVDFDVLKKNTTKQFLDKGRGKNEPFGISSLDIWKKYNTYIIIKKENDNVQLQMEFN